MIFLKVYSIKRIKREIIFSILLLIILIISLFHIRNWEEVGVFSVLKKEVILVIAPSEPSKVYINEVEISKQRVNAEKTPYIYKIKADDSIQLRVQPIGDEEPVEKTLKFDRGGLIIQEDKNFWNCMSINEWPNQVYEISINLSTQTKIGISEEEILITEERVDIDQDNDLESLQIIKQGQLYFLQINKSTKVLLRDFKEENFQWLIQDINNDSIKEIVIRGSFGETNKYIEIFQYQQKEIKRIFWEHGDDIAIFPNGSILIGRRLFDTVDHYEKSTFRWLENEYQKSEVIINWWQGMPIWPTTKQNTVKALFEADRLGLEVEVKGYLIEEHQNDDEINAILSKVQKDWRTITPPIYYFLEGYGEGDNIYVGFIYDTQIHPQYNKVKVYEIELEKQESKQGPWKIRDIIEPNYYSSNTSKE